MNDLIKFHIKVINQLYEMERKITQKIEMNSLKRNIDRLKNIYEEEGFFMHNPLGEPYNEMRTDCEAEIGGQSVHNLRITNVIKPLIYQQIGNVKSIVQKAVVIVEAQK